MIFSGALILFPILFVSYLVILRKYAKNNGKNLPPSPPSLPILGHLHILKDPHHRTLRSLSQRYGPILFLRLGQQPVVVVSSPEAVEECFTKNDKVLSDRPRLMMGQHLIYNFSGLVMSPYGDHWRNLRKVITIEALCSNRIQLSAWNREEELRFLVRDLVRHSREKSKVNLTTRLHRMLCNIMMKTLNGEAWDTRRQHLLRNVSLWNVCDFIPVLRWVGYKGLERSLVELGKWRDEFCQELVDEARERLKGKNIGREELDGGRARTMVEQLVRLQQAEPEKYTEDIIKGLIMPMLTAGTETTSKTMEWTMSLLISNPKILEKARAEISSHVKKGHLVDDSDVSKLTYLRCIINEALRLFPVAPLLLPHSSSQKCTIGGYDIPKGTMLLVNAWAIHRDPKVWEDPTKFKPERFIEGDGERDGFKFLPFGAGRRVCPGSNLAIRIMSLVVATLIQCFDWEMAETESTDMTEGKVGVTMPKGKPLEVFCNPRSEMVDALSHM